MKERKKIALITMLIMALVMGTLLTGCKDDDGKGDGQVSTTPGAENGDTATNKKYKVSVRSEAQIAMEGTDVYIYADSSLGDMKAFGTIGANGQADFELPASDDYVVVLSGIPKGYVVEDYYKFDSTGLAMINLKIELVKDESLSSATLGLGDVMYDFTVKTPDGAAVTLSKLLEEKKMVLINFWYTTCTYCVAEFPFMEEAYQMYKDDIAIVAINPMDSDADVKTFQEQQQLSFYMATCPPAWSQTFSVQGYPTSIAVDRYGVICMIEAGGITSLRPFTSMFEHFTSADYQQKICENGLADLVSEVKPTYTMDTSENVGAAINKGDINVTYAAETGDDGEYSWPFIIGEKNGETCIYASNKGIESSYAILYATVELKAGQAVGFDYLASSESGCDIMHVIVNKKPIYNISGVDEVETWKSCYPYVASEDGTYKVALCYRKDEDGNVGDDTVYVKDFRVIDASEIDTETFIPREVASTEDGFEFNYADIVFSDKDGYYHIGTVDGPLLLADLMNYTLFNEEKTVYEMLLDGQIVVDGHDYYDEMVEYCSYASNSSLTGVCTVNKELAEFLKIVAQVAGFNSEDENEWLKICKYYEVYGAEGKQMEDPIKGLAIFSAMKAEVGVNVKTNYFFYDRVIMPRGMFAEFTPTKSGVYRITSKNESISGVDGWIFDENKNELIVYEPDERLFYEEGEVSIVYYFEKGKSYYIDIAFWDLYETGYIYYDIEYIAPELEHFRLASPGYFTYDSNATGDEMYYVIAGGIDVVLGSDGIYYEDLGKDANGKQKYGSKMYADFTGVTSLFSSAISSINVYDDNGNPLKDDNGNPIVVKGLIDLNGFDFSKTENDLYILAMMANNNNDPEATDAYLRETWGEQYETYAELYLLEDVYAGIYHGKGEDRTADISKYLDKIIKNSKEELNGCVVVDKELAELLQLLMDKYTFENVDHAWTKLCYYYDYLGPKAQ